MSLKVFYIDEFFVVFVVYKSFFKLFYTSSESVSGEILYKTF